MAREFRAANSEGESLGAAVVSSLPMTFATWVRLTNTTNFPQYVMAIQDGTGAANGAYWLYLPDMFSLTVRQITSGIGDQQATGSWGPGLLGRWVHAVAVFASLSSRSAYLNGLLLATNTTNIASAGTVNSTTLAFDNFGGTPQFFGDIQVAYPSVWNTALSPNEIVALSQGIDPITLRRDALVASWDDLGRDRVGTNHMTTVGGRPYPTRRRGSHVMRIG